MQHDDGHQAYLWNAEAKFEETERKQVRFKLTATPNPDHKGPVRVDRHGLLELCRELQYTLGREAHGIRIDEAYVADQLSHVNMPNLDGSEKEPVVIMDEVVYIHKSVYPQDIERWTTGVNERMKFIIEPLQRLSATG